MFKLFEKGAIMNDDIFDIIMNILIITIIILATLVLIVLTGILIYGLIFDPTMFTHHVIMTIN